MASLACVVLWLSLLIVSTVAGPLQYLRREQEIDEETFWNQFEEGFLIDGRRPNYRLPNNGIIGGTAGEL